MAGRSSRGTGGNDGRGAIERRAAGTSGGSSGAEARASSHQLGGSAVSMVTVRGVPRRTDRSRSRTASGSPCSGGPESDGGPPAGASLEPLRVVSDGLADGNTRGAVAPPGAGEGFSPGGDGVNPAATDWTAAIHARSLCACDATTTDYQATGRMFLRRGPTSRRLLRSARRSRIGMPEQVPRQRLRRALARSSLSEAG